MYVKYKNMHEMELLVSKYLECLKVTKLKMKKKLINGLRSDSKLLEVCLCHMEHFILFGFLCIAVYIKICNV